MNNGFWDLDPEDRGAPDPQHYTYRVFWSPEDEEFVGLCVEFPSLSWLAETQVDALRGILELVQEVLKDMYVRGETPPPPLSDRRYSGKFMIRATRELHARLVREAAEQGVSLNQLATQRLAGSH